MMSTISLILAYLTKKLSNTLLNILIFALGIATVTILLLASEQIENNFFDNLKGVDTVVGAKGSPLQLILSSVMHIDNPTGNITIQDARKATEHRLIAQAIPLALGDSYQGVRIVGTTEAYPELYGAVLSSGDWWHSPFEATVGANVATRFDMNEGYTFFTSHGLIAGGHVHDDHALIVAGVMAPTGTVLDNLILTSVETVWYLHAHDHHEDEHEHDSHEEELHDSHSHSHSHHHEDEDKHSNYSHSHAHNHDHSHNHTQDDESEHIHKEHHHGHSHTHHQRVANIFDGNFDDKEITALIISFRSPIAATQFPRMINEETNMQAASPAVEMTRLFSLFGIGLDVLRFFGFVLMVSALLGIFIALRNAMEERRFDLAILRTYGASRSKLFGLVVLEGMVLTIGGLILGLFIGHFTLSLFGNMAENISISGWYWADGQISVVVLVLAMGFLVSLLPAVRAYRTEISKTLSNF